MALLSDKTRILLNLFIPQRSKPNPKHTIPEKDKNLKGKIIVFTGGTDGMGRVAVDMLYKTGGTYLAEDTIKPPHKEAQIESKRKHIEQITRKALRKWL